MGGSKLALHEDDKPKETLVSAKIPLTPAVRRVLASIGKKRAIPKKHLVSRLLTWFAARPYNFQAAVLGQLDPATTRAILTEVDRAAINASERMQRDREQAPSRRLRSDEARS